MYRRSGWRRGALALAIAAGVPAAQDGTSAATAPVTENVVLVTIDGLRWQELFGGADRAMLDEAHGGIVDLPPVRRAFWRRSPAERRRALMPFFWTVIAERGQVFGDAEANCVARCTNGLLFSYPGYQELLCGYPDERLDSNAKRPNPNVSVLEWLHDQPRWRGRVAAFCCWDVFPWILNEKRAGFPVNAGWEPFDVGRPERIAELNEWSSTLPRYWPGARWDALTVAGALEYLHTAQPRVLFVGLDETDDWAHQRRYDLYLQAARGSDRAIERLWTTLQAMPQYAGRTSLVVTTDHGRGGTPADWTDHGAKVPGADRIWIAVLGPDTPALGIRRDCDVTQSQVAATVAALLGAAYHEAVEQAAPPLPGR